MGFYIGKNGVYYDGDKADMHDMEVPQRPDVNHVWDRDAWVFDRNLFCAEHNAPLLEQIAELEARQARPLRELALGIDGARERLLALDNQISALRGQLEA